MSQTPPPRGAPLEFEGRVELKSSAGRAVLVGDGRRIILSAPSLRDLGALQRDLPRMEPDGVLASALTRSGATIELRVGDSSVGVIDSVARPGLLARAFKLPPVRLRWRGVAKALLARDPAKTRE